MRGDSIEDRKAEPTTHQARIMGQPRSLYSPWSRLRASHGSSFCCPDTLKADESIRSATMRTTSHMLSVNSYPVQEHDRHRDAHTRIASARKHHARPAPRRWPEHEYHRVLQSSYLDVAT